MRTKGTGHKGHPVVMGVDNGVSGTVGIIAMDATFNLFFKTPTFMEQNYTKTKKNISRINVVELKRLLEGHNIVHTMIERPMVNPGRFQATVSAIRAMEATLIVMEALQIPYEYVDSRGWQKMLLPQGIKGADLLKKASLDIGKRLFPKWAVQIQKQKDADGLLIAEFCRRTR